MDEGAPREDDGHYNVNNVLLPTQIKKTGATASAETKTRGHRVLSMSSAPPGTNSHEGALTEAPIVSAGGSGAPLLTKEQSHANLARWIPHVTPAQNRPVTRTLPQNDGASASKSSTSAADSKEDEMTEAPTVSAGGSGAPLLTKEQSQANLARRIPHVTPDSDRPVTRTLPQNDGASVSKSSSSGAGSKEDEMTKAPIVSAGGSGAPLLSKEQSGANLARRIPHVTPDPNRPVTRSLSENEAASPSEPYESAKSSPPGAFPQTPADEPSSFSVAPLPASGHEDTQSSVTTSKEDYENAGGEGTAGGSMGILPVLQPGAKSLGDSATTSKEDYDKIGDDDQQVSVNPLPAEGHKDIQSSATTSKEDYDKVGNDDEQVSVNPLPATGHKDIQSSTTTSKEDYEKAGAFGAAGAAIAGGAAYLGSVFSRPKAGDKNIIPESSLPMGAEKTDTMDTGPFMNSAGPGTTTADLASKVPLEPKREAQVVDEPSTTERAAEQSSTPFTSSSGPGTTTADLASEAPLEPKREAQVIEDPSATQQANEESSAPFVSSSGPGTTTSDMASQVPLEPKRDAQVVDEPDTVGRTKEASATPFTSSSGPGTTTSDLASQVPKESKREAQGVTVPEAPEPSKEANATPFINSAGAGATTAALASQVPIEQKRQGMVIDEPISPEITEEKSAVEKELMSKIPESQATGEPASAAKGQFSYYGLATAVPEPVEESMAKAHASPEAATEPSAVAEKSMMERELQSKVPVEESAGESAPTISAATATSAPSTGGATLADSSLTDGMTANEPVPGTDTSDQTGGISAGEIAGGAVVGGAAAAGAATLAAKHEDRDIEPPRIADSQKPIITSEAAPAQELAPTHDATTTSTAAPTPELGVFSQESAIPPEKAPGYDAVTTSTTAPTSGFGAVGRAHAITSERAPGYDAVTTSDTAPTAGIGAASPQAGVNPIAAAALSDGTEDPTLGGSSEVPSANTARAPVETSEATAVEYAPPRAGGSAPGVAPNVAAALSDGTEDPTLMEEPAVKMMTQNEAESTSTPATGIAAATTDAQATKAEIPSDSSAPVPTSVASGNLGTGNTNLGEIGSTSRKTDNDSFGTGYGQDKTTSTPTAPSTSKAPETPKKTTAAATGSAASSPATKGTPESSTTGEKKKKKNRLSAFFKKVFD